MKLEKHSSTESNSLAIAADSGIKTFVNYVSNPTNKPKKTKKM